MGNNGSHNHKSEIPRNNSKADPVQQISSSFDNIMSPMEKLGKLLAQKSLQEDAIVGIGGSVFKRYLFPNYSDIGKNLFLYLCASSGTPSADFISIDNFRIQTEKILSIMSDDQQITIYLKMYANGEDMSTEQFHDLLYAVYKLAMDHYPEGSQSCRYIFKTMQAVVDSAFHGKTVLKISFLRSWIITHCPRIILLLHRFIVHVLSTGYRSINEKEKPQSEPSELELTTPVLEKVPSFEIRKPLLPLSQVWLLATTLPQLYIQPTTHHSSPVSAPTFLSKVLDLSCPSHWTLLYNSNQDGIGFNRFEHHVLHYRGPTLTFIRGTDDVEFCLAVDEEWRLSHLYWGGSDCMLLQILPQYKVVEKGAKICYINTRIRGYHYGIRIGSKPSSPSLNIDGTFEKVTFCDVPYSIGSVEVWGCSSPKSREIQLQVKEWNIKQAENHRKVKISAADWLDHPDRFLLQMAGRESYTTNAS